MYFLKQLTFSIHSPWRAITHLTKWTNAISVLWKFHKKYVIDFMIYHYTIDVFTNNITLILFSPKEILGLGCGHVFCIDCWRQYLTTKISDDGEAESIACPDSKCDIVVDDMTVMQLVDESTRQKYQYLITNSFVQVTNISLNLIFTQMNNRILFLSITAKS